MQPTRVIGLMSGTSVDGIDAALVEIAGKDSDLKVELIAGETYPLPPTTQRTNFRDWNWCCCIHSRPSRHR